MRRVECRIGGRRRNDKEEERNIPFQKSEEGIPTFTMRWFLKSEEEEEGGLVLFLPGNVYDTF